MKFTKMQGCGNDYVYVNCFEESVSEPGELAKKIADRHYGVGGDGLILIEPSKKADARMRMFNQDGSEGAMCGNGLRCVAKFIYDHGLIPASRRLATVETRAGLRRVELAVEGGRVEAATVDMGPVRLTGPLNEPIQIRPEGADIAFDLVFTGVDVGNPHAVYFLDDNPFLAAVGLDNLSLDHYGPAFEHHKRFPGGVNSEFVEVLGRSEVRMRVWERGSGETLACGTGASAVAFAGMRAGKLNGTVLVHLAGGDLRIRCAGGRCFMRGPAVEVFTGEWPL